ncbi:hypothetical protein QFZ68_005733 [Streptomyces sp. V1I6]|nr:hypothetical protein [Streptomyces sp. V1I6]
MKREFGRRLIENFFPKVDLTHVVDTSGAYIPGHGTPTVILAGRNRNGLQVDPIRAVLGIRGEASIPDTGAIGPVWRAIVSQVWEGGTESEWVGSSDLCRSVLAEFPWSLSGGGASGVMEQITAAPGRLGSVIQEGGRTTHTGLDDAFYLSRSAARTRGLVDGCVPVILGPEVRDFSLDSLTRTFFPYGADGDTRELQGVEEVFLWPNRTILRERVDFGETPEARGLRWFDHSMFFPKRYRAPLSISFAFVATHNQFVLDRGGKVFKQSAPVIKLPKGSTEDQHLELLGILNSSTACFWLKQVSQAKGGADNSSEEGTVGLPRRGFHTMNSPGPSCRSFRCRLNFPLSLVVTLTSLLKS